MMKILIIKLGALGDVVRTLSILPAIKERYPESEIYWITKPNAKEIFENNPDIKKLLTIPCNVPEEFDILYNFDIEEDATKLAQEIKAKEKYGFYSENNYPAAFNISAEYYLNTLFDDELKKSNIKTYQEMMFEAAQLEYKQQMPVLYFSEKDKNYAEDFIKKNNINPENLIGIHMGASDRWPSKAWSNEKIKDFVKKAKQKNYNILLFGGPNEKQRQEKLISELKKENINVYSNNPNNSIREFISLLNECEKVICSDSFALHIALALKKPTIGLFFCTSPNEVEGYHLLKKIVSGMACDFFPEKMDQYSEELVNSISSEEVIEALE